MNALLPHDPALPQLATALDARAMARIFGAALDGPQLLTCEIDRIKYRPQRNCSVSYRLQLRDAQRGDFEQRIAARFCSGGDAARRLHQASQRTWVASAAGPALQYAAELDMLAFWLPNDAKLEALRLLCDDAELRRRCLGEVVAALSGGRGRLVDHATTLVQVVPELRACARVELRVQHAPGTAVRTHTLYAKASLERPGATTHAVMQALSDSPAQAAGRLRTARSLLWQPSAGLHWQEALPGRPLLEADPAVGAASSARVGRQLAALHLTPVPRAAPAIDATSLMAQAARAADLLGGIEPQWRPRLARLSTRLAAGAAALDGAGPATLHGDLHPHNILVDSDASGTRHAFIDLDDIHRGPAAIELGAWIADAHYRALHGGVAPAQVASACNAFLAAYAQGTGRRIDAAALAWSAAHHLLCQRAYRGVANLKPGRFAAVPALLALADRIAQAGTIDAAFDGDLDAAREAA